MDGEDAGSLSPFKIHWKAPLQTKGFLRIVQLVLAILTFSLVAGFSINMSVQCVSVPESDVITATIKYPFSSYSYSNGSGNPQNMSRSLGYSLVMSSGQFFVAMGVFSMFYCMIALAVYVLFTANEQFEKVVDILVYVDLGCNAFWVFLWFVASVAWTVAYKGMQSTITTSVFPFLVDGTPIGCNINAIESISPSQDTYEQAAIATVFGFLCMGVWAASIYWVIIDTALYIKWRNSRRSY